MPNSLPVKRSLLVECVLLLALVAALAYILRPLLEEPSEPAPARPDFDLMLTAVGDLPPGLLERMRSHIGAKTGLRVRVGLPYLSPIEPQLGKAMHGLQDLMIMPRLESQARTLGATTIGVTSLPLECSADLNESLCAPEDPAWTPPDPSRVVFWGKRSALLTTHRMPDESRLMVLLGLSVKRLTTCFNGTEPRAWSDLGP